MFSQGNLPESIAEIFLAKSGENVGNEPNRSAKVIYLPYIADITIYNDFCVIPSGKST